MFRVRVLTILAVLSVTFTVSHSARILGLFPTPAKSHLIVHMSMVRPMIERGHDVTIVTTIPLKEPNLKFRHIKVEQPSLDLSVLGEDAKGIVKAMKLMAKMSSNLMSLTNLTLNSPEMQKLMREESFDLVILGNFLNDFLIGVAGHFKCPIIINFSASPTQHMAKLMGNPLELSYVPDLLTGLQQPMGFFERVVNYVFSGVQFLLFQILNHQMNQYYT